MDIVIRTMTIFSLRYIHAIMLAPKLSQVSSQFIQMWCSNDVFPHFLNKWYRCSR